ncbi:hypothetical protein AMTR_s00108p00116800 [Amborella trichopoda]|uniref:Uncharacterized protein n=1 Tax=Amborella trichopoda TaxID=13333 RepID=W1NXD8_AMBTC|nr:hypothetical protein AMTR_s00108p00116800 [Amborella trichopoda]
MTTGPWLPEDSAIECIHLSLQNVWLDYRARAPLPAQSVAVHALYHRVNFTDVRNSLTCVTYYQARHVDRRAHYSATQPTIVPNFMLCETYYQAHHLDRQAPLTVVCALHYQAQPAVVHALHCRAYPTAPC